MEEKLKYNSHLKTKHDPFDVAGSIKEEKGERGEGKKNKNCKQPCPITGAEFLTRTCSYLQIMLGIYLCLDPFQN